jgi:hypothetical protein
LLNSLFKVRKTEGGEKAWLRKKNGKKRNRRRMKKIWKRNSGKIKYKIEHSFFI